MPRGERVVGEQIAHVWPLLYDRAELKIGHRDVALQGFYNDSYHFASLEAALAALQRGWLLPNRAAGTVIRNQDAGARRQSSTGNLCPSKYPCVSFL
jgi:hypothetical protein